MTAGHPSVRGPLDGSSQGLPGTGTGLRLRDIAAQILSAALRAVDPAAAVHANVQCSGGLLRIGPYRSYALDALDRILVVGGGKAGAPMAAALVEILDDRIGAGQLNVKAGYSTAANPWRVRFGGTSDASPASGGVSGASAPGTEPVAGAAHPPAGRSRIGPIKLDEAGHPLPDDAGLAGARRIEALLQGLAPRDLVIVLLSGGGSALLPLPAHGITLGEYRALTDVLVRCGADITEINAVRKHCSRLQGGQLARLAAPARVATLILSDVVGSPLDAIASGPTVPDRSTFGDALAVLERHEVVGRVPPAVLDRLRLGAAGGISDTPKPGDPAFERVVNVVVGDNAVAGRAAAAEAQRLGLRSALLTTFVQGEAREVGRAVAGLAQGIACGQSDFAAPACLVLGGETTVTVRGDGLGGRNQELALGAAIALDGHMLPTGVQVAVVSLGTDGTDGPTGAAGAIATQDTLARGRALGLDARAALAANDSYRYLAALGDLVITGPTNTNVNDLILVLCA